jgi:selenide,water dikinase
MGPEALAQVLRPLQALFPAEEHPELLIGLAISDDAAVYRINADVAVIQTLDFFTPIVDDPYDYGAIAAANAMSDVYAMGGEVVLALNICGFPSSLPPEMVSEILRGGAEKVAEAGGVIAGGHTIDDDEPKYGMSVMGLVHPERVLTKAGAQPGDALILTKPLGVGIITTAFKGDRTEPQHLAAAVTTMKQLNRQAAQLIQQIGVHACTDITGFALLGHGYEMAERSDVRLRFYVDQLPFLDGAHKYADLGLFPGGTCNNEQAYEHVVTFDSTIPEETQQLLYTPETSGGLLVAVPPHRLDTLITRCSEQGLTCWVVGQVLEGAGVEVVR